MEKLYPRFSLKDAVLSTHRGGEFTVNWCKDERLREAELDITPRIDRGVRDALTILHRSPNFDLDFGGMMAQDSDLYLKVLDRVAVLRNEFFENDEFVSNLYYRIKGILKDELTKKGIKKFSANELGKMAQDLSDAFKTASLTKRNIARSLQMTRRATAKSIAEVTAISENTSSHLQSVATRPALAAKKVGLPH